MDKQATPRPWAYCKYGNFENESYVEQWFAIVPEGQEPEDKYSEIQFEIARVGVAFWRHGIGHREVAPEEDEANAELIVRCVNQHDALEEALEKIAGHHGSLYSGKHDGWAEVAQKLKHCARAALDAARLPE